MIPILQPNPLKLNAQTAFSLSCTLMTDVRFLNATKFTKAYIFKIKVTQ